LVEPCPPFSPPDLTLTQPWATVGAAVLAIIGALIAYAGVTKTARSTRQETRRKERADVLTDSLTALQALSRAMLRIGITTTQTDRNDLIRELNNSGRMEELHAAASTAAAKLMLYGFTDVRQEWDPTTSLLQNLWEFVREKPETAIDVQDIQMNVSATAKALTKEFGKLR